MKGNAFWVGKGASGYSITSVVDGEGMPHGRKWQSDNLRPGDIGISLRLDMKNQPEMSADQKKVLAEQVKLFSEQALKFLGQEPVQSFFVAPGDFVVPDKKEPDWLGKVIKVDQLGVTLHRVEDHGCCDDSTIEYHISEAPLVFIPWNNFQVIMAGKSLAEVFSNDIIEGRLNLGEIFYTTLGVHFLLAQDPSFDISSSLNQYFDAWLNSVSRRRGAYSDLMKVNGFREIFDRDLSKVDFVWKNILQPDGIRLDNLFVEGSLSNCTLVSLTDSTQTEISSSLNVKAKSLNLGQKKLLAKEIVEGMDRLCFDPKNPTLLYDQDFLGNKMSDPKYIFWGVQHLIGEWVEELSQGAESAINRGLANDDDAGFNAFIQRHFGRPEVNLDLVISSYKNDLTNVLSGFDKILWEALVEKFQQLRHPLIEKMAEYQP